MQGEFFPTLLFGFHKGENMDKSPHKSDFVSVNGIRLHYLDWGGSGEPLLFLPGLGNSAHIFDGFAPLFTDKFRVLALTRRGHGDSDHPESGHDVDTLTEDIRCFMDELNIEKASGMWEIGIICFGEHESNYEIIEASHDVSSIAFGHTSVVLA